MSPRRPGLGARLLWFAAIWAASVIAVASVAEGLHWWIAPR